MRVDPITDYLAPILVYEPPPVNPKQFNPISAPAGSLLQDIQKIKSFYIQQRYGSTYSPRAEAATDHYERYLQFPNTKIRDTAKRIVDSSDSLDEKAYKIMKWVQDNINYRDDLSIYGRSEYWALPTMTLSKKAGDCEDGAFLEHSLMLAAGIPYDRIRTYGGLVWAGAGAETGGHGWTAYKREVDNEWVVVDWCYYPSDQPISERTPLKDDKRYIDDFFYVTALDTVDATYTNEFRGVFVNVVA